MKIGLTFNGTGAGVYLCIGFIPDLLTLTAVEDTEIAVARWGRDFRAAESMEGYMIHNGDQTIDAYTAGQGFVPYEGGDLMNTTIQTSVGYGEGVYLKKDKQNYAKNKSYGYTSNPIDTWTLGSSGNRTGNFNDDCIATVSRIGEGSRILIEETAGKKQKWANIEALTAGEGSAANEVTLSRAITSGKILYIGGMYDMIPIPIGEVSPKGIYLAAYTEINVNDEINMLVAETLDN